MQRDEMHIDSRIDRLATECRRANMRVTPQRLEIFRELLKSDDHPAVETLYQRVRKRQPTLSLDTLYRTLATLESAGLVSRVGSLTGIARFEANMTPHDHFLCVTCGKIADIPGPNRQDMVDQVELPEGYEVQCLQLELRGICAECAVPQEA
ncbi:MAG: transcriptional repressor [Candidatus Hydrogenedentes bacterium]|nr:transcriptional repressor [Candidatus Hydrogenedentota bacterium]